MGFGMRKEVYKRKAKKPFVKIKEIYGDRKVKTKNHPKVGKLTREEVLNKPRFKSIHDLKVFQILKVAIMLLLLSLGFYYGFLKKIIYDFKINNLTNHYLDSFNTDHEWLLNRDSDLKLFSYIKIDSSQSLSMTFGKSFDRWSYYSSVKPNYYSLSLSDSTFHGFKYIEGNLNIIKNDTAIALKGLWKASITGNLNNEGFNTKINVLNIEPKLINDIRQKLRDHSLASLEIEKSESQLKINHSKEFGDFYYLKTDKHHKEGKTFKKIKDKFYLKREKDWK